MGEAIHLTVVHATVFTEEVNAADQVIVVGLIVVGVAVVSFRVPVVRQSRSLDPQAGEPYAVAAGDVRVVLDPDDVPITGLFQGIFSPATS
ncbi:hypothetical protein [Haloactinomyces albus]|uniref:Uncharacterized protein n=1 Tax=Haloactinomyces albus TaxID=1352928 RepID=A0AAE3ZHA2_9ACTN|nr:hypothetical protein [Haloactinomyces albus]MDR7303916.1 hypothetical protein [Haloactinomyces albus]